jgi:multidrug efflux pump subunit AcrA (membrane-fusion protein)
MNKKTVFIIGAIVLLVTFGIYKVFIKKEKPQFTFVKVSRGVVFQEVSETGAVEKGEKIKLAFKNSERVEKIYVKVGDKIETKQNLAKLDTKELLLQLKEAEASLQVIQAEKANTEVSLKDAKQNLEDAVALAEENLANGYQDALNALDDAYLKIYNAYTTVSLVKRTYFERGDQESITVADNKDKISRNLDQAKFYIDNAKKTLKNEDIDTALLKVEEALINTKDALELVRSVAETGAYKDIVSSTDRTSLDTQKSNINTSYDNITSSQQNISTIKINNTANINTAQSKVSEIESQLQETKEGLYLAKIKQAEAKVDLLKNQIEEYVLKSPTAGQITEIEIREGEIVQSGQLAISIIADNPFQITVDIYEEDVVKLTIGNAVEIKLTAFPDKIFKGKLISIDPAEKLIEGVVYYEAKIELEDYPETIKPGMTADIIIKTVTKENVLAIPEAAIEEKDSKKTVQVLKGKNLETREIEIGLKGSDMVEVISGLEEGEEVAIEK